MSEEHILHFTLFLLVASQSSSSNAASSESLHLQAWEWKWCRGKTDGDEIVELFGTALHNFRCVLLLISNANVKDLIGCDSRVAVAAVIILQWQIIKGLWLSSSSEIGNVSEGYVWVKPACMIPVSVKKLSICSSHAKDCYMSICYWSLSIDSLKTAEQEHLLPHICIMGKMIHISICSEPDGSVWLLWEHENILVTDDIKLWLPPSLLSDEIHTPDWWQRHLKNPPFSHPTSLKWTAPRGEELLSKIRMCQYIYGAIFLQRKEMVWTFKLAFFFNVVYIIIVHFLRGSSSPVSLGLGAMCLTLSTSSITIFLMNRPCGYSPNSRAQPIYLPSVSNLSSGCSNYTSINTARRQ